MKRIAVIVALLAVAAILGGWTFADIRAIRALPDVPTAPIAVAETATPDPTSTPDPTATPDPTSTPEPTATPEPTPTPEPKYPSWMKRYWGKRVHRIITKKRWVALTFDDGPMPRTADTIAILDKYQVKGTFFVTGVRCKAKGMAKLNRRVVKHGHEIANHTMHHHRMLTRAESLREIRGAERIILKQTGVRTRWVRAMGGAVNRSGIKATRRTGHLYAQWSLSIADAVMGWTPPSRLYHNIVDHVRPGAIVLMHVTHPETIKALPRIIRTLKARGYKMVTLSKLASTGKAFP